MLNNVTYGRAEEYEKASGDIESLFKNTPVLKKC